MSKKPALGKGLSALLENSDTDVTSKAIRNNEAEVFGSIAELSLEEIEANPFQPRTKFEDESLRELAQSIEQLGIIQPVTVRKTGYKRYQLISGERRFRASQFAGVKTIPAFVRVANDQAMLEMALVENIQRESLDAVEISISYQRLIEECNLTQEQMSERVGKKRSTITNYLRLLKLPAEIQLSIRNKEISMGHARALVSIDNTNEQLKLHKRILDKGLSVRQVEDVARNTKSDKKSSQSIHSNELSFPHQKFLEDLSEYLGTEATLNKNAKGAGKIVIPFKSDIQLEQIIDRMDL